MKRCSKIQLISVATILGIGWGIIWGFSVGGGGSMLYYSLFDDRADRDFETIVVDSHGRPYVRIQAGNNFVEYRYRTIEGDPVDLSAEELSEPVGLSAPYRAPGLFKEPIAWRERIGGLNSPEKPPGRWVFLRDDQQPGKGYLLCYDPKFNHLIGYLGRDGFRESVPPPDEQFDIVAPHVTGYGSNSIATLVGIQGGQMGFAHNYPLIQPEGMFSYYALFLCDGNAVRRIDLLYRDVHLLAEFEDLVGIAIANVMKPISMDAPPHPDGKPHYEHRLLVRTRSKLVLYNTFRDTSTEFPIPAELIDKPVLVYPIDEDRLILNIDRGWWERGNIVELLTIKSDGKVESRKTVELVRTNPQDSPYFAFIPACIIPVLIGWLGGMFLVAPLVQLQNYDVATFTEGVTVAWDMAWLGLMLVTTFSIVLAAITYRWQRKYSRPNTGLWTTFVFLTTLPGFLAYWVMHRREPMGACQHCGANVPQDRDLCAKCAAPLPAPKLLGTEIFA